ncbi:hypothetical protein C0J52_08913 [Blattella germanica]|nr:hypothetical protein C0J52_08913 [Blattella germanica]
MSSAWASRMKIVKIVLVSVIALHIGTYYIKPLLLPEKSRTSDTEKKVDLQERQSQSRTKLI